MPRRIGHPDLGYVGSKKLLRYNHRIVLGSSGAIASQDAAKDSGIVAVKTATKTGRYTLTFSGGQKHKSFRGGSCTVKGPDDTAYGAVSVGLDHIWRDDDLPVDGTLEVQFLNASTNFTDAELPTGTVIYLDLVCEV
jgi:hypothetical protein